MRYVSELKDSLVCPAGVLMAWSPPEFERHAGMGCNRKWRNSLKVTLSNNKRMSLGTWLVHFEQHRLQQQVRMQQDALILQQQQQQQQQADMQPQQLLLQTAGMDLLRPGEGADLPYHQAGYSTGPPLLLHPALPQQQQQQQQVSGSWLQASHAGAAAAASAAAAAGSLVTGVPGSGGTDHLGYGCYLPAGLSGFVAADGSTAQRQQVLLQAAPWHQQQQQQQPRGLTELPGMGLAASAGGAEGFDVAGPGFGGMTATAASPALAASGAAAGGAHDLLWAASGAGGSRKRPAEAAFGPSHDVLEAEMT